MKKYFVKFLLEREVVVEVNDNITAQQAGERIVGQFSFGTCKVLSVRSASYVQRKCPACAEKGTPPNKPKGSARRTGLTAA